jgi:hypothetical protein
MAGIAKIRIGRVTLMARDKPPGYRSDIYPKENGAYTHGVMELSGITAYQCPAYDTVTYQRVE